MLTTFFQILFQILFYFLSMPVAYFLVMAIAGKLRRPPSILVKDPFIRIAILIPAYKEDNVIIETCRDITNHDYPTDIFSVFVAAHHLNPATIEILKTMRLQLFEIESEQGSKALSLQHILNSIDVSQFDIALILD